MNRCLRRRSAGCQTCCVAGFQACVPWPFVVGGQIFPRFSRRGFSPHHLSSFQPAVHGEGRGEDGLFPTILRFLAGSPPAWLRISVSSRRISPWFMGGSSGSRGVISRILGVPSRPVFPLKITLTPVRQDLMRIQTSSSFITVFWGLKVIQGYSRLNFFPPGQGTARRIRVTFGGTAVGRQGWGGFRKTSRARPQIYLQNPFFPHPASRIPHPASRIPHPASRIPHRIPHLYFLTATFPGFRL